MYFTTFNHDDILYNDTNNTNDECLICWEPSTTNNNIIKMQSLISTSLISTSCRCNGLFHYNCLFKWIKQTNTCPICHTIIELTLDKHLKLHYNHKSQLFRNINYTIYIFIKVFKYFLLLWSMNMIYNIIFHIQYSIEQKLPL